MDISRSRILDSKVKATGIVFEFLGPRTTYMYYPNLHGTGPSCLLGPKVVLYFMQPKPKTEADRGRYNALRFFFFFGTRRYLHIGGSILPAAQMRISVGRPGSSGQARIPTKMEIVDPISMIGGGPLPRIDWCAGQVPSSPNFAQVTNVSMHVSLFGGTQVLD